MTSIPATIDFKETLCKLLYQNTFQKPWEQATSEQDYLSFIQIEASNKQE